MNSLITYIDKNIRNISLEAVNILLLKIIEIKEEKALNYLSRRNFHKWILSFYGNKELKNFINENNFPTLKSKHSILIDKVYKTENNIKGANDESDINDQQFINKLNHVETNKDLITHLSQYFDD